MERLPLVVRIPDAPRPLPEEQAPQRAQIVQHEKGRQQVLA